ncbi:hypothetical protein [Frigoriglobus tundricola]|nr:hypothetical protein [Frigoriglobus tundricola]
MGLALAGCGPLQAPLPARLDDGQQKAVNESWEQTLSPVDRFSKQSLLDFLLLTNTYQFGVDKLEFRSEKSFSGGVVVMEVRFDRSSPERDLFTVTVQDRPGKVLRQERYGREQIERSYSELHIEAGVIRHKRDQGIASPEELRKLEAYEARHALVNSVLPAPPEDKGKKPHDQRPKK